MPALCSHPTTSWRRRGDRSDPGRKCRRTGGAVSRGRLPLYGNRGKPAPGRRARSAASQRRERLLEPSRFPTLLGRECESAFCRPFHPHASVAEHLVRAAEEPTLDGVVEVNGVMIRKHELESPERVFRARLLDEPGQSALAVLPNEPGSPQLTGVPFLGIEQLHDDARRDVPNRIQIDIADDVFENRCRCLFVTDDHARS